MKLKLMSSQVKILFSVQGVFIAVYTFSHALKARCCSPLSVTAFITCLLIKAIFSNL